MHILAGNPRQVGKQGRVLLLPAASEGIAQGPQVGESVEWSMGLRFGGLGAKATFSWLRKSLSVVLKSSDFLTTDNLTVLHFSTTDKCTRISGPSRSADNPPFRGERSSRTTDNPLRIVTNPVCPDVEKHAA